MRVSGIWRRKSGQVSEPPANAAVPDQTGYWEGRLHIIGSRLDGYAGTLQEVVISIGGGSVWVSALQLNESWAQPSWATLSFRVEGLGIDARAAPALPGRWALALAAAGRVLDRDALLVREPCIMQHGPGLLITGLVQRGDEWLPANWLLDERGELA